MHVLSTRAQLAIGVALILLLAMTRGQHFASVENLPSASWSIFFLAGFYLRPRAMFALLFAEASVLDFASLASGTISDWCLSPAYWALVPAYGSLWLAGRLFAGWQRGYGRTIVLDHGRADAVSSNEADDEYYKQFEVPDDLIW